MNEEFDQVKVEFSFDKPLYNILVETANKLGVSPKEVVKSGIIRISNETGQ